jgi:hypothetical protein
MLRKTTTDIALLLELPYDGVDQLRTPPSIGETMITRKDIHTVQNLITAHLANPVKRAARERHNNAIMRRIAEQIITGRVRAETDREAEEAKANLFRVMDWK